MINDLLQPEHSHLINSVVVTVAPTYLGQGGVGVSPSSKRDEVGRPVPAVRFQDVKWQSMDEDAVMCGRMPRVAGMEVLPGMGMGPHAAPGVPARAGPVSFFNSTVGGDNTFQRRIPEGQNGGSS